MRNLPDKTVTCESLEQFADLCLARGLTFQADADRLHIYLTGGY